MDFWLWERCGQKFLRGRKKFYRGFVLEAHRASRLILHADSGPSSPNKVVARILAKHFGTGRHKFYVVYLVWHVKNFYHLRMYTSKKVQKLHRWAEQLMRMLKLLIIWPILVWYFGRAWKRLRNWDIEMHGFCHFSTVEIDWPLKRPLYITIGDVPQWWLSGWIGSHSPADRFLPENAVGIDQTKWSFTLIVVEITMYTNISYVRHVLTIHSFHFTSPKLSIAIIVIICL